jgi:S1-C subfamily serine protease
VIAIEANSPAPKAGVAEGDVIVGFAGHGVVGIDDFNRRLTEPTIGLTSALILLGGTGK